MKSAIALTLLVALAVALAAPTPKWNKLDDVLPSDDHLFSFRIAFKKQNLDLLDSMFWQINDYYSPMFGKHLTNEQIKEKISLPEEDIAEVEAYLKKDSGKFCEVITRRSIHQDYLYVDTCAAQGKVIFPNLKLAVYEKERTGHLILRHSILMDEGHNLYLLGFPANLHRHIDAVYDVTSLPVHLRRANSSSYPDGGPFDPTVFWQPNVQEQTVESMIEHFGINYDGITDETFNADEAAVRQGVIEFNHATFDAHRLAQFQATYHRPSNPVKRIIGTEEHPGESVEADLDFQTITSLAGKAQTWDFVFGVNEDFIEVVEKLLSTPGAPKVYSCSWGGIETQFTKTNANAINSDLMKLGLNGMSFFIASGDAGPTLNNQCNAFDAQYPASSAYVISVGGTVMDAGHERSWERSSGGFSRYISRPEFQDEPVKHYFSETELPANPDQKIYPLTGRAYPDVAAFGAYEPVFTGTGVEKVGGTSGSCPQFAAIATLVNLHRYQKGLGPIGAINKTLYQLPKGVGFDVTTGRTYAASANGTVNPCTNYLDGFFAAPGWDAATGLGSPRFETLLTQFLNIPGEKSQ